MFHPVPRVDRWEPWIELGLIGLLAVFAVLVQLLT
jgi:hypothetical protein